MIEPQARLEGLGVVYFGNEWHAENRTSSHHVAVRLAQVMQVLYVDSPGMRAPTGSGRDLRRGLRKIAEAFRAPEQVQDQLWRCTVPQLPFRQVPGVEAFNRLFSHWAVRRAMRRLGMGRHISWFVVPHPGFLAHRLQEELCVFYCIDDYAAHPGVDTARIARLDEELSRDADLLFVAPPALLQSKRALNASAVSAPHGVDYDLFSRASEPATRRAPGARDIPGPIVGYIGSIHEWIDLELLHWLAEQRPQWSFLLVGHAAVDVRRLRALPNVHLAGGQPYASLPGWAKAFDAAIIPYRLNRQVANANPLKLREYLATGKPVVSTRNAEIANFSAFVSIADSHAQFLAALDQAIAGDNERAARARMASVADQTWDSRVNVVLAHVAAALQDRAGELPLSIGSVA